MSPLLQCDAGVDRGVGPRLLLWNVRRIPWQDQLAEERPYYGCGTPCPNHGTLLISHAETKLYPAGANMRGLLANADTISHSPEDIKKHFQKSLDALKADKIYAFYLHGPDRSTPYKDTLRALNELHQAGKFKVLGVSNYHSPLRPLCS